MVLTRAAGPVLGHTRRAASSRWDLWFPQEDPFGIKRVLTAASHWEQITHNFQLCTDSLWWGTEKEEVCPELSKLWRVRKGSENHLDKSVRKLRVNRRRTGTGKPRSSPFRCIWSRLFHTPARFHPAPCAHLRVSLQWHSGLWERLPTLPALTNLARNLPSLLNCFSSKKHLPVNLPVVQMSVWNCNDIY